MKHGFKPSEASGYVGENYGNQKGFRGSKHRVLKFDCDGCKKNKWGEPAKKTELSRKKVWTGVRHMDVPIFEVLCADCVESKSKTKEK